jgi:predicted component of type VI protein secretion system
MAERFEFSFGSGRASRPRDEDRPMRLLVLGDFSGPRTGDRIPLAERPTHRIDVDTIERVMNHIRPGVALPAGDIQFSHIDDFHPDRLFRLTSFDALREAQARPPAGTDETIGRLLGRVPESAPAVPARSANPVDALIQRIVAPHIVKDAPGQDAYAAAVGGAMAEVMRGVLHDAAFQSLEAAWRGVQWLVSGLELDEQLQVHLLDVTREELVRDIVDAQGDLARTGLHRVLVDRWRNVPGGEGWSALVVLFDFGPSDADVGLLAALGLIASQAGGPLLGGAAPPLSEAAAIPPAWQALRRSEAAPWIGLAAPRVLLRLPYGRRSDPIESFAFEEFPDLPERGHFLWGTGSLAVALLIGRAFTANGWTMEPADEREIGDMPAYTFVRDGESHMQACAERFLTESEIQALVQRGLIPLASRRDRNAVVAVRFQSIADPPAPLAW